MHLAFGCSHKITQNNDFSFSVIIFYFREMFLTLFFPKTGSRTMQWYKMKGFAAFSLKLFMGAISYDKLSSFLTYL